jgi:hypothetical protein
MRHWVWIPLILAVTVGVSVFASVRPAWALAGNLDRPSIAIPSTGEGLASKQDPVCAGMQKALTEHAKQFIGGRFINAHTKMEFGGTTAELNALLKDLAAVEGAALQIRFSKGSDDPTVVVANGQDAAQPGFQWRIEHNAWVGDPQSLLITVYLGDGKIKLEEVQIPTIIGKKPATTDPPVIKLPSDVPTDNKP